MTDDEIKAKHGAEYFRCLDTLDIAGIRKLHAHTSPHLAQINTTKEALYALHMARTACEAISLQKRMYSDRWLRTRGVGSYLPAKYQLHPDERR